MQPSDMHLYLTTAGPLLKNGAAFHLIKNFTWDDLIRHEDPVALLRDGSGLDTVTTTEPAIHELCAPIGNQEVWAAGVTYLRSRTARMDESQQSGGSDFYDRVYHAERPELFLKATAHRCAGTGQTLHLRSDSRWIVPEPELTLVINPGGRLIGVTAGNDLSCRDIEGENPLYLPQAKTFKKCAGIGPGVRITDQPPPDSTQIEMTIQRGGKIVFEGQTVLGQMKKKPAALMDHLFRENDFPNGCLLMTGTGIVPPDDFTLQKDDEIHVTIGDIGTLVNRVS